MSPNAPDSMTFFWYLYHSFGSFMDSSMPAIFALNPKLLLLTLLRSLMAADQKPLTASRSVIVEVRPGTHSDRRKAPVNPAFLRLRVMRPIRPPPATALTDPRIGTFLARALGTCGSGMTGSSSSSSLLLLSLSPSSSSSSSVPDSGILTVSTIPTGSTPSHSAVIASTRAVTCSSPHLLSTPSPPTTQTSGMGCNPASNAAAKLVLSTPSPSATSSTESISSPPLTGSIIPTAPAAAISASTSRLHSVPSLRAMAGTGPGKFPRAPSCSTQKVLRALTLPATRAALALATVRTFSDSLVTSVACRSRAVGSVGSGMAISGLKVSLPDGEERDCCRMRRAREAASLCWVAEKADT
mmetsp:Transcript_31545/g.92499  ORF Transcript_31545/g.92499 Transcript_31545/m.92499 type:complete len:355 (+) Transcript_31545:509-1573(+)